MAEPVTLYPVRGGEPLVCAAPSEVQRLVEMGEWTLEPLPQPEPEKLAPKPAAPEPMQAAPAKPRKRRATA